MGSRPVVEGTTSTVHGGHGIDRVRVRQISDVTFHVSNPLYNQFSLPSVNKAVDADGWSMQDAASSLAALCAPPK